MALHLYNVHQLILVQCHVVKTFPATESLLSTKLMWETGFPRVGQAISNKKGFFSDFGLTSTIFQSENKDDLELRMLGFRTLMHFSCPFRGCQNEGQPLANNHPKGPYVRKWL